MSAYIHVEMLLFLQSACMGALLLLCYDLLAALRQAIPHHPAAIAAEDLLYWLLTGMTVFARIYQSNQGILRSFLFLGMILGVLLCHATISPLFVKIWTKILTIPVFFIKKLIKRLLFLGGRCKIFMYKSANQRIQRKKERSLRIKRGKQIEKVEKKKQ